MLLKELYSNLFDQIIPNIKDKHESDILVKMLLKKYLNIDLTNLIINPEIKLNFVQKNSLNKAINRLNKNEPIQYILEETEFYGYNFYINKDVLIPRPETEELVDIFLKEINNANLKILDLCTGSGCIAITLDKKLKNAEIYGIDVSKKALKVAKKNADQLKSKAKFLELDILKQIPKVNDIDIIISNPPYILKKEKKLMHDRVLKYEPEIALFVDTNNPLIFYEKIIFIAKNVLNKKGKIYLEINESLGQKVKELFEKNKFMKIKLVKDFNNKERYISANKS